MIRRLISAFASKPSPNRTWYTIDEGLQKDVSKYIASHSLEIMRASLEIIEMELDSGEYLHLDADSDSDFVLAVKHAGTCRTGTGVGRGGMLWDCNNGASSFSIFITTEEYESFSEGEKRLLYPLR